MRTEKSRFKQGVKDFTTGFFLIKTIFRLVLNDPRPNDGIYNTIKT